MIGTGIIVGIATALNELVREAEKDGIEWNLNTSKFEGSYLKLGNVLHSETIKKQSYKREENQYVCIMQQEICFVRGGCLKTKVTQHKV